jgi:hypothetical protein
MWLQLYFLLIVQVAVFLIQVSSTQFRSHKPISSGGYFKKTYPAISLPEDRPVFPAV